VSAPRPDAYIDGLKQEGALVGRNCQTSKVINEWVVVSKIAGAVKRKAGFLVHTERIANVARVWSDRVEHVYTRDDRGMGSNVDTTGCDVRNKAGLIMLTMRLSNGWSINIAACPGGISSALCQLLPSSLDMKRSPPRTSWYATF
jgi:hypothetical protein